jgi:hypothetical protein
MKHHEDHFAHNSLPNPSLQPHFTFTQLPQFQHPEMLNCVEKLLDNHIKEGHGNSICIRTFEETWTYLDLFEKANQISHVLIENLDLKSGNRVLIRSANNPMMVACWFAIIKAGGIPIYSRSDKHGLMDVDSVLEILDTKFYGKKPKAVIPCHINSRHNDVERLQGLIDIIEDAAPAYGVKDKKWFGKNLANGKEFDLSTITTTIANLNNAFPNAMEEEPLQAAKPVTPNPETATAGVVQEPATATPAPATLAAR